MKKQSFDSPKDIFLAAIDINSIPGRETFLSQACDENTDLRRRVDALIRAHNSPESLLDHGVPNVDGDGVMATIDSDGTGTAEVNSREIERPGSHIGRYKLLQHLGEGGMGVVYMAEQTEPVKRRVALKIIKPGMDSGQVVARFEAERQALAMMDHPNIARVLDAGSTESKRPYFVMELVKGVPITQYCDDHRLSSSERLKLFSSICRGVQHAHLKGIIHRDLKPSNVLVAEYDNQPVPKIIDFGVAKATHQELTEKTLFTQIGQIVGTLDYMSPEQAKLNQLDIDTRSDIYSLGVLLYELLTGSTPIEKGRLRQSGIEEILRIIREEEPPRPSTRLSSSDALPALAANRSTEPGKLAGQVRDDLDWIVAKAMAKERGERYQTPDALADDIDRHLNDLPIMARRPSVVGRARRFARRHRTMVSMATLVLVVSTIAASLGGIAYMETLERQRQQSDLAATRLEVGKERNAAAKRAWAHNTGMPEVRRLIGERRPVEAFQLVGTIRKILAGDPAFDALWNEATVTVSLNFSPAETMVSYRNARLPDQEWTVAGRTPLIDVTLPRGDLRFRYEKQGYVTREFQRKFPRFLKSGTDRPLVKDQGYPKHLVLVHGQTPGRDGWDSLGSCPADLSDFLIDRYEVSNQEYQAFVDAGGYEKPRYWTGVVFDLHGETLTWEEAMTHFVDSTGEACGPAGWINGKLPAGREDFAVGGVSWFEAVAYANFVGKSLPSIYHWAWAANSEQLGLRMALSNFSNQGDAPRGFHDGIGRFDVYDMAGNQKEWCWNADEAGRRYLLGGAWNEPDYRFVLGDVASPWERAATHGFRCVGYLNETTPDALLFKPRKPRVRMFAGETLRSRDSLEAWYHYDHDLPFNAKQIQVDDRTPSPDYRHEIVQIDAVYNSERYDIHLFLPREKQEQYETIVWVPSLGAWNPGRQFAANKAVDWHCIKDFPGSGRIVCYPVYKGTYERCDGRAFLVKARESPFQGRDDYVCIVKDISRTVDYLLSRHDVDADRLLYMGNSFGGILGPIALATDRRFKAAVLRSAGYLRGGEFPEIRANQFTPHVETPVLMINGVADTIVPYETAQLPMFEDLGSRIKDHVVLPHGHGVPTEIANPKIEAWLQSVFNEEATESR